jgi:hypothetical protein
MASLLLSLFSFSFTDVGEDGDPVLKRRGIGNRKHSSYVVSINSSIKNHRLLGELEHLNIKTRLIDEKFASVMGEYVFSRFKFTM